jgi:hypothetical protein
MGASREEVWLALSELWLDNQLDEPDHRRIAAVLQASELPLAELQAIYLVEVAPLLWLNHWGTAGVWSGFDPAWLSAAVGAISYDGSVAGIAGAANCCAKP